MLTTAAGARIGPESRRLRSRRRHGSVQLHGPGHRSPVAECGTSRSHPHRTSRTGRRPVGDRGATARLRGRARPGSVLEGGDDAVQHDLARLAVDAAGWPDDRVVDAVGPERPTFVELVDQIRTAVGSRARIVRVPPPVLIAMSKVLGAALHDVLLTGDEYRSMRDGLADSDAPVTGRVALSTWLAEHGDTLGTTYANELDRHFR